MIKIFSPKNEAELTVIRSILESERIPYHIRNEHFGSLYPGIAIKYINAKTLYVPREYKDDVLDLLNNFIDEDDIKEIESSIETDKGRETPGFIGWIVNALTGRKK